MKIVFFGLGSIGNRHAKILSEKYDYELLAFRTNKGKGHNDLGIQEVQTWDEIDQLNPDIAFITNPTFKHIESAIKCAKRGMKLFIEKPIGSSKVGLNELIEEVKKRKLVTYIAYNLRFHPVIEELKKYLEGKEILNVKIHTSSFLPEWRSDNHLESYSASKEKGGGVILDLSHEFDYIEYLFGEIKNIDGHFDKVSNVTKDAEDVLDAAITTNSTSINLHLDIFSRKSERTIKINCKEESIKVDLINATIEIEKKGIKSVEKYDSDKEVSYKKQLEYFFSNIDNDKMMNNISEASALFNKILDFKEKKV